MKANNNSSVPTPVADYLRRFCGYRFPPLGSLGHKLIMQALPSKIQTKLFPGVTAELDLREEVQRTTYWFGTRYERPTPQILRMWGGNANAFFDVGANYGFFTFYMHAFCPGIQIHAFEPNPKPFSRLSDICQLSKLKDIRLHPFGLSDIEGEFPFYALESNSGHSGFSEVSEQGQVTAANPGNQRARTCRFDDFIDEAGISEPAMPSWIAKIDVEGYELKTLVGMKRSLQRKAFLGVCIEVLAENLALARSKPSDIDDFMKAVGYVRIGVEEPRRIQNNAFFVPAG